MRPDMLAVYRAQVSRFVAHAQIEDVQSIEHDHQHVIQHGALAEALGRFDPHLEQEVHVVPRNEEQQEVPCRAPDHFHVVHLPQDGHHAGPAGQARLVEQPPLGHNTHEDDDFYCRKIVAV